jgi:hypothetical protein
MHERELFKRLVAYANVQGPQIGTGTNNCWGIFEVEI